MTVYYQFLEPLRGSTALFYVINPLDPAHDGRLAAEKAAQISRRPSPLLKEKIQKQHPVFALSVLFFVGKLPETGAVSRYAYIVPCQLVFMRRKQIDKVQ